MEGLPFGWVIDLFVEAYNAPLSYVYMLCISHAEDSQVKIPKRIHVKMLNNEEIVSFPHFLVVNHCNADDFELGETLIVNFWS